MGWSCSWIAVRGAAPEILAALELAETGETVEPGSGAVHFAYSERPDGWTVVFSEDFDWASRERVLQLSSIGHAVGCQFEDRVMMTSIASAAQGGVELWRVAHENDPTYRLDVSGEPPAGFAAIREALFREQEANGGENSGADFIHDVPLEVAKSVCGYRADEDETVFMGLRRAGEASRPPVAHQSTATRGGFLSALLAPFRRT